MVKQSLTKPISVESTQRISGYKYIPWLVETNIISAQGMGDFQHTGLALKLLTSKYSRVMTSRAMYSMQLSWSSWSITKHQSFGSYWWTLSVWSSCTASKTADLGCPKLCGAKTDYFMTLCYDFVEERTRFGLAFHDGDQNSFQCMTRRKPS